MIKFCRACESKRLVEVLSLGDQYLSDFVDQRDENMQPYALNLVMCQDCDLVQLRETTPSNKLYNDHYGYYSGISNTIKDDLASIVQGAVKHVKLFEEDIVVDIGSNDATLLKNYPKELTRVGFDPVTKFKKYYEDIHFVNDYFSYDSFVRRFPQKKARIITAISMFYDLDDPNSFVSDLQKCLAPNGVIVIQQNYLATMLENLAYDNIVHEHLEYYSLTSLTRLLNRHGLDVVDVYQNSINGGSFKAYVKHMDNVKKMRYNERAMRLNSKNTYFLFALKVKQVANKLHRFVKEEVTKGKKVYVYGASTRGNSLLQAAGLDNTLLTAAVERNPVKFGKKIASIDLPIISEEEARAQKPDYFLVLPWFFKNEIVKREEEFVKGGGCLIFPLPELTIVNASNFDSHTKHTS